MLIQAEPCWSKDRTTHLFSNEQRKHPKLEKGSSEYKENRFGGGVAFQNTHEHYESSERSVNDVRNRRRELEKGRHWHKSLNERGGSWANHLLDGRPLQLFPVVNRSSKDGNGSSGERAWCGTMRIVRETKLERPEGCGKGGGIAKALQRNAG